MGEPAGSTRCEPTSATTPPEIPLNCRIPAAPPVTPASVTAGSRAAAPAPPAAAAAGPVGSGAVASPDAARLACCALLGSTIVPIPVADNAAIAAAAATMTFLELFTANHHPSTGPSSAGPDSLTPRAASHPTGS